MKFGNSGAILNLNPKLLLFIILFFGNLVNVTYISKGLSFIKLSFLADLHMEFAAE